MTKIFWEKNSNFLRTIAEYFVEQKLRCVLQWKTYICLEQKQRLSQSNSTYVLE
jgi:hypothetical protein